jgi:hypothetical protein
LAVYGAFMFGVKASINDITHAQPLINRQFDGSALRWRTASKGHVFNKT